MKNIKHISFDLWMTLIKSNPTFKSERAKYFFEHHNSLSKPLSEISLIIRDIDLMVNKINELNGNSISSEEMYLMVLYRINENLDSYNYNKVSKIYAEINELFNFYPPSIYDNNTLLTLSQLKEKNISMSILSNTAFIKGISLVTILKNIHLFDFFDYLFFSDEFNLSKPNVLFFEKTFNKIKSKKELLKHEVLHVGDNVIADFKGAENFGYKSILINSNNVSIQVLTTL